MEKKQVKVTDDDICNRKIEFKTKKGIITGITKKLTRKYGELHV